jgi:haloalkane dehalogenase
MTSAPLPKKFATVNGRRIAYAEAGTGAPIVLLHGNPTSSYLWRDVIPYLAGLGRVIAPDLIGQGDSEKLPVSAGPGRYSFGIAYDYLAGLLEALGIDDRVTLVVHDWGSALGFHWAHNHPDKVRGIAYMEGIVCPIASWDDWPAAARGIFQGFRSAKGEDLILKRNMFIEAVLPPDPHRRRARRDGGAGAGLCRLAGAQPCAQAVHQCRAGFDPGRPPA